LVQIASISGVLSTSVAPSSFHGFTPLVKKKEKKYKENSMKQNVEEEIKSPNPPPPRFAQLRLDLPGVQPAEKMRD